MFSSINDIHPLIVEKLFLVTILKYEEKLNDFKINYRIQLDENKSNAES